MESSGWVYIGGILLIVYFIVEVMKANYSPYKMFSVVVLIGGIVCLNYANLKQILFLTEEDCRGECK